MSIRARRLVALVSVVAAVPWLLGVSSVAPQETVMESLEQAGTVVLAEGTRDSKLDGLKSVARKLLDTRVMGRNSLGAVLEAQGAPQQAEFLELFDEVMVRAYLQKLLFFRKPRFELIAQQADGDGARVQTKIVTRKDNYTVDYALRRTEGRWWATDVVVEGVSLTANYGEQFRSLLRTRSFDELLTLMRRKVHGLRGEAS